MRLVAADSGSWHYTGDPVIPVLGAHDICGFPTGIAGPDTTCTSPWSAGQPTGQALWASELGGMDAHAQPGCVAPCAPAMDRAVIRGYVDARLTGFLEWPVLDAMPPGLPYENRGLLTAGQPWAGSYQVNAMTWAIAQLTQFAQPPDGPVRWRYINQGSGFLQGSRADGSYVSLVRETGTHATAWSSIIEATTAPAPQLASFRVTGGDGLASHTVHVWASDFATDGSSGPARWFVRQRSIRPSRAGRFSLTVRPGWVYSLTTTSGQGHGRARPAAAALGCRSPRAWPPPARPGPPMTSRPTWPPRTAPSSWPAAGSATAATGPAPSRRRSRARRSGTTPPRRPPRTTRTR